VVDHGAFLFVGYLSGTKPTISFVAPFSSLYFAGWTCSMASRRWSISRIFDPVARMIVTISTSNANIMKQPPGLSSWFWSVIGSSSVFFSGYLRQTKPTVSVSAPFSSLRFGLTIRT
jgi:hypothetical protein